MLYCFIFVTAWVQNLLFGMIPGDSAWFCFEKFKKYYNQQQKCHFHIRSRFWQKQPLSVDHICRLSTVMAISGILGMSIQVFRRVPGLANTLWTWCSQQIESLLHTLWPDGRRIVVPMMNRSGYLQASFHTSLCAHFGFAPQGVRQWEAPTRELYEEFRWNLLDSFPAKGGLI